MSLRQKVLIVASDRKVVTAIGSRLEKDGYQVLAACDGGEALELILRARPDILVVDRSELEPVRPGLGSRSLVGQPVIVLTHEDHGLLREADSASGVIDHLGKPVDPREVLCRVRAAIRRAGESGPEQPQKMRCSDIVIDRWSHQVRVCGEAVRLTPTEFRLLAVLVGEPGRAFARLELLERVFGSGYEGLERTIDTHVRNLRKKVESDPADPTYIETVYGVGYRFGATHDGEMGNGDSEC